MSHSIDMSKYSIRTDLIMESIHFQDPIEGLTKEQRKQDNVIIDEIRLDEKAGKLCNKAPGIYKTISFEDITDTKNRTMVETVFVEELGDLLKKVKMTEEAKCLIIGLGNEKSTPDALGPKVIDEVLVTRHLFLLEGSQIEEGYRNVAAFTPNVMGSTGIETSSFILGVIKETKPDFLVVIDALASSSVERLNRTIQMTDTGIAPGSGVGNTRKEISKQTVGIPVIAVGVPTIVDAVTIVSDTFHFLLKQVSFQKDHYQDTKSKLVPMIHRNYKDHEEHLSEDEKTKLFGMIGNLSDEEMKSFIFEVLTPLGYNLMVTPKEVDFVIDKLSQMLSHGLNRVLHKNYGKRQL